MFVNIVFLNKFYVLCLCMLCGCKCGSGSGCVCVCFIQEKKGGFIDGVLTLPGAFNSYCLQL